MDKRQKIGFEIIQKSLMALKKEVSPMKKSERVRLGIYGLLIAMAVIGLSLILSPNPAWQVITCSSSRANNTTDTDLDGFTDYQECLLAGVITPIDNKTKIWGQYAAAQQGKSSINCSSPPANNICLDPNKQDLFVIIVPASSGSLFPTNPLQYVSTAISQGGLGIAVHPIYVTSALLQSLGPFSPAPYKWLSR